VLLSIPQAAEIAGYDRTRISQFIREGRLTVHPCESDKRKKLIDSEELARFLENPPIRQRSTRTGIKNGTLRQGAARALAGDMPPPSGPHINIKLPPPPPSSLPPLEPDAPAVSSTGAQPFPASSGSPPIQAKTAPRTKIGRATTEDDDFSQFLNDDGSYNMERCRAWGEFEKARKLQVERMAAEGKYVAVADVAPVWSRVFVSINRGIMGIANRVKADNPDLDVSVVNQIEYLCREALKAVSEEVKSLDIS
jgi:hypothetical protein